MKEPGKEQPQQVHCDGAHCRLAWQILSVEMIDATDPSVGGEQLVSELSDGDVHGGVFAQSAWSVKNKTKSRIPAPSGSCPRETLLSSDSARPAPRDPPRRPPRGRPGRRAS